MGYTLMKEATKSQIEESYSIVKPYLNDDTCNQELKEMCNCCESWCGKDHDYNECENRMCFKFFLAYKYLELLNSL